MRLTTRDIVSITTARAKLTELAEEVVTRGEPKLFTKNGESFVALITAEQLDEYLRLKEAEDLSILNATVRALEDVNAGRTSSWEDYQPRLEALRERVQSQLQGGVLSVHEPAKEYVVARPKSGPSAKPPKPRVPAKRKAR